MSIATSFSSLSALPDAQVEITGLPTESEQEGTHPSSKADVLLAADCVAADVSWIFARTDTNSAWCTAFSRFCSSTSRNCKCSNPDARGQAQNAPKKRAYPRKARLQCVALRARGLCDLLCFRQLLLLRALQLTAKGDESHGQSSAAVTSKRPRTRPKRAVRRGCGPLPQLPHSRARPAARPRLCRGALT
jgi:hypothetical protein